MSGEFRSKYPIGSRVVVYGAVGTILAVIFGMVWERPQYQIRFDTGGADSLVDESELATAKAAA